MWARGNLALGIFAMAGAVACGSTEKNGSMASGPSGGEAGSTNQSGSGGKGGGGDAGTSNGGASGNASGGAAGSVGVAGSGGAGAGGGAGWKDPTLEDVCDANGKCVHALTQRFGGGGRTQYVERLKFDSQGNLYATLESGVGKLPALNKLVGHFDVGVSRWTPEVRLMWSMYSGGTGYDHASDLRVGKQDELIILGAIGAGPSERDPQIPSIWTISPEGVQDPNVVTVDLGKDKDVPAFIRSTPGGATLTIGGSGAPGGNHLFVRREAAGSPTWTTRWGSGSNYEDGISGFAVDAAENVYVAGVTNGTMPGATFGGEYDAYLAKLDATGKLLWVKQWGGERRESIVAIARVGDYLYLAGQTPPEPINFESISDVYLTKLDLDGKEVWTKTIAARQDFLQVDMVAAENGRIYVAFDSGNPELPLTSKANEYGADLLLTEFTEAGDVRFLYRGGGSFMNLVSAMATYENRIAVGGRAGGTFGTDEDEGAFLKVFTVDP